MQTRKILALSKNKQKLEINIQYYILWMNLIMQKIPQNKVKLIFITYILIFVIYSSFNITKANCLGIFIYKNNYVNKIIHNYIIFYTKKWVESLARMIYRFPYKLYK